MKYYVYVLYSKKYDKIYVGYTNHVLRRMHDHNVRGHGWTSHYRPWVLVHVEEFSEKSSAIRREKELKTARGRKYIREEILLAAQLVSPPAGGS